MVPQPQGGPVPAGAPPQGMTPGGNPNAVLAQLMPILQQHIANPGGQQQIAQALAAKMPAPPAHIIQQLQSGQVGHMSMGPNQPFAGLPQTQAPAGLPAGSPPSPLAPASPAGAPNPFLGLK